MVKLITHLREYWKSDSHLPLQYWRGLYGKTNNIAYRILEIWYASSTSVLDKNEWQI
jgi:hypothetical protein